LQRNNYSAEYKFMMYALFYLFKAAVTVFGSVAGTLYLKLWGVKTAGMVKCVGIPRVEKTADAQISIGRNCCLRSARCSNVAGVFHPVSLCARGGGKIIIGDDCGLSSTVVVADTMVRFGDRVMIGANCVICDTDFHPLDPAARAAGEKGSTKEISLDDDVWVGMNCTILKGVSVGKGSVIAAGSVVTKSIPPGVVAGGVPAKVLKEVKSNV